MIIILSSITKYFFRILGSIYCFTKILHIRPTKQEYLHAILFSLLTSPVLELIKHNASFLTLHATLFCVVFFCYRLIHTTFNRFSVILFVSMLSISIEYILSILTALMVSPLLFYFFPDYRDSFSIKIFLAIVCGSLQLLSLFYLFRLNRFKKGIPDIEKNISSEVCLLICMPVFYLSFLFSLENNERFIVLFAFFLLITISIILCLWWRKYLFHNYIHKSQNQTIKILEETISEQKEEIDNLSKIIHKDNKLIGALYLSAQELCNSIQIPQSIQLKKELELLSQERKGLLQAYENNGNHLPKTEVFSTDVIISYLFRRALDNDIHFDVTITGDIQFMTETVLEEALLNTLLADLGENAIIATSKTEKRNILLSIGVRENHYYIDFFDSGSDFDVQVIENLGKRRYTTHKNEGGSGIGLMTTFELLKKKKGSFELEELQKNNLFTKRVSIIFDSLFETRISSNREEILTSRENVNNFV